GDGNPVRALKRHRSCRFAGRTVETPIFDGALLRSGDRFDGPAIIEETTTTVVIPGNYACQVDPFKNYVLTRAPADAGAATADGPVGAAAGGER
ncbi:MAG: hydantoinase/oxoprolinase family protein, partial [Candidatus Limnocylindrales bacterium]